jgi:hypothetical protein
MPGDEIHFDPGLDGQPILLDSSVTLDRDLTIVGRGSDNTIIDANQRDTVLSIPRGRHRVVISGVTITGGHTRSDGGGIRAEGRSLTLSDSVIAGNWAGGSGGGIYVRGGELGLSRCTLSNNTADFYGAGIYLRSGNGTLSCSSVAGNSAGSNGGGTYTREATLVVNGCTVSGNTAGMRGGGLYNSTRGSVRLNGCTVTRNSALYGGGGIDSLPSSTHVILNGTIVAGQSNGKNDCFGTNRIVSEGYNLDSDGTCYLRQPTDLALTDPMLGPLADNGGPTWTHALLAGSPAIDRGTCCSGATDQRGVPCPVDIRGVPNSDDGCDIGAFEALPPGVQLVGDLHDLILTLIGEDHDLVAPLQEAIQILEDGDPGNDGQAVGSLLAFIAEVEEQRGLTLSDAEADELIAEAERVIQLLGLGGSDAAGWSQP